MRRIIIGLAICLMASASHAGEEKRGEAGFMFLKVPLGARETSLGMSGITTSQGAQALFWNPANASLSDRPTFSFTLLNHFAGITSNYGAVTFPLSDVGVFGASLNYVSYGDITKTTESSPDGSLGSFSPFEMAIGFSYSKQITDRVSGGLTLKFLSSKIDFVEASAYAFDFGFTYNTGFRNLKLGFVASNLGPQTRYTGDGLIREVPNIDPDASGESAFLRFGSEPFELPASVNFGASMDLYQNEQNSVTGMWDQNINSFQASRTNLGIEYGYRGTFFLRTGYTTTLKRDRDFRTGKSPLGGLTLGTGVSHQFGDHLAASFDYGYMNLGILDATHRFTLNIAF